MWPTREEAWQVLNGYTKNPHLITHALAVEAGMKAYARRFGEDEERWAVVGLIHDFELAYFGGSTESVPKSPCATA